MDGEVASGVVAQVKGREGLVRPTGRNRHRVPRGQGAPVGEELLLGYRLLPQEHVEGMHTAELGLLGLKVGKGLGRWGGWNCMGRVRW